MSDPNDKIAVPEHSEKEHDQPHDPKEINPKMASDIAYWSKEFGVSGQLLHEAIRMHGTKVETIRKHLAEKHDVNLT